MCVERERKEFVEKALTRWTWPASPFPPKGSSQTTSSVSPGSPAGDLPGLYLFITPGHVLRITQHERSGLYVQLIIEHRSVSMEAELSRAGNDSNWSSPGPGVESRVCTQQVLRKYLGNEGERQSSQNQIPSLWLWGPHYPHLTPLTKQLRTLNEMGLPPPTRTWQRVQLHQDWASYGCASLCLEMFLVFS